MLQVNPLSFFLVLLFTSHHTLAPDPACRTNCGLLQVRYPFGTGPGCGSSRFHPYVTCSPGGDHLLLTTHTGSYPISSISYTTSTLIITPPYMSTCSSMQNSPNLGLDWSSPFQLGPSTFLLLSCEPPTSSLSINGIAMCDSSSSHLCTSIYSCPSVVSLGLPLFPPANTCCVYSPANFNSKGELDLHAMKCAGYASVVTLGDFPTDPTRWGYGVALKYEKGGFDEYNIDVKCNSCEVSGGVCGYAPPANSFVCVCKSGFNSSMDCNHYNPAADAVDIWSTDSSSTRKINRLGILAGLIFLFAGNS